MNIKFNISTRKACEVHNVTLTSEGLVRCGYCGGTWEAKRTPTGRLAKGWWQCPNEDNTRQALSANDNSGGSFFKLNKSEMATEAEKLLSDIEKLLEPFLFDFQGEILRQAIARIPKRRAAYEAGLVRDNALGKLSSAVDSSGFSLRSQTIYYGRLRRILLRRIGRATKNKKNKLIIKF